jgi:hypothetical protein
LYVSTLRKLSNLAKKKQTSSALLQQQQQQQQEKRSLCCPSITLPLVYFTSSLQLICHFIMFSSMTTRFLGRSAASSASFNGVAAARSFHASAAALEKLNVEGLASKVDLSGKNVLVRVDLNVPLAKVS